MKKPILIGSFILIFCVAFGLGLLIGISPWDQNNDIVGVYTTNDWNGKTGTLVLYEDGTCQYPSGGNATWSSDGDTITIITKSNSDLSADLNYERHHEAKIMEKGIVLHGYYFEKVSD